MVKNTEIKYKTATEADLTSITSLFKNTIRTVNTSHYSTKEIKAWSEGYKNWKNWKNRIQNHYFLLAFKNDDLKGMASVDDSGYLDVIYISTDYQGRGLASALLQKMEDHAAELGHQYITSDVSITAKPFFIHKGYVVLTPQLAYCRGLYLRNYNVKKALAENNKVSK